MANTSPDQGESKRARRVRLCLYVDASLDEQLRAQARLVEGANPERAKSLVARRLLSRGLNHTCPADLAAAS